MVIVTLAPSVTIFTPPASCTSSWTYEASSFNDIPGGLILQNALPSPLESDCIQSGLTVDGRLSHTEWYSPGYCPAGYTVPSSEVSGGTTSVICCQESFQYTTTLTLQAFGTTLSPEIFAGCLSTLPYGNTTAIPSYNSDLQISAFATVKGPLSMWAQPLQFAFQAKDLANIITTSAGAAATSTAASPSSTPPSTLATATFSPVRAAADTASPTASSSTTAAATSGLSSGAKAGIGVGVILGVLALAAAGFALFFFLRRRRQREQQQPSFTDSKMIGYPSSSPPPHANAHNSTNGSGTPMSMGMAVPTYYKHPPPPPMSHVSEGNSKDLPPVPPQQWRAEVGTDHNSPSHLDGIPRAEMPGSLTSARGPTSQGSRSMRSSDHSAARGSGYS